MLSDARLVLVMDGKEDTNLLQCHSSVAVDNAARCCLSERRRTCAGKSHSMLLFGFHS